MFENFNIDCDKCPSPFSEICAEHASDIIDLVIGLAISESRYLTLRELHYYIENMVPYECYSQKKNINDVIMCVKSDILGQLERNEDKEFSLVKELDNEFKEKKKWNEIGINSLERMVKDVNVDITTPTTR